VRFHFCKGKFDQVLSRAELASRGGEDSASLQAIVGLASALLGQEEDAVAKLDAAAKAHPANTIIIGALGYAYAVSGREARAREVLAELKKRHVPERACCAYALALVSMGLVDADSTLHWLEEAYRNRSIWILTLALDPVFLSLRQNSRFQALLDQLLLPTKMLPGFGAVAGGSSPP